MMRKLLLLALLATPGLSQATNQQHINAQQQSATTAKQQLYQQTLAKYQKIVDDAIKQQKSKQAKKGQANTHTTHTAPPAPISATAPRPIPSHPEKHAAPKATPHAVPMHQQTAPTTKLQPASAGFHISYD